MRKIKIRNHCQWFWDQLHHEHPFRNLFISRNAWSAFSVYSHIRRSDGVAKIPYPSKEIARKAADKMRAISQAFLSRYINASTATDGMLARIRTTRFLPIHQ